MTAERALVPVEVSATLRRTVEYAVESTLDRAGDDEPAELAFAFVLSAESSSRPGPELIEEGRDLLDRVAIWADEDAGERADDLSVTTEVLGEDEYLFSPTDFARVIGSYAVERGIDRVVFDPEYDPGVGQPLLHPLEYELARDDRLAVEEAPVEHPQRHARIVGPGSASRFATTFLLSFGFYQLLAGGIEAFDLITGAATGLITAIVLSRVTFSRAPRPVESVKRLARWAVFAPVLLWEILVANLQVAAVILNPRASIDPRMTRIHAAVWGGLPITTLANSITLTPGTLTVRARGRELYIHTLLPVSRDGLFEGSLERWTRFVFYGRRSMRIDSPRDRGDAELLQPPAGADAEVATDGGTGGAGDVPTAPIDGADHAAASDGNATAETDSGTDETNAAPGNGESEATPGGERA